MQRRDGVQAPGIDRGAMVQQQDRNAWAPRVGRGMECGEPAVIARLEVGSGLDQRRNGFRLVRECGFDQGRLALSVAAVHVTAGGKELLDLVDVACPCRVMERRGIPLTAAAAEADGEDQGSNPWGRHHAHLQRASDPNRHDGRATDTAVARLSRHRPVNRPNLEAPHRESYADPEEGKQPLTDLSGCPGCCRSWSGGPLGIQPFSCVA